MTTLAESHRSDFVTRTAKALLQDQLDGITAWQEAARVMELAETARRENRQAGTEARRRLEALRRTNAALLSRSHEAADDSRKLMGRVPARAVVVHRLDWMRDRLASGLAAQGLSVIAQEHDGADGLGVTIAEQPELLVVEDRLPSIRAAELVSSLRQFAPRTLVAAQVENPGEFELMLEAGADAVFSRRVPPASVCAQLAGFLRDRPQEPLVLA